MKNYLLILVLFICFACNKTKNVTKEETTKNLETLSQNEKSQFLTIDINKEYPKSDRICLQDIAEVEYLPMETTDDFLFMGPSIYLDDEIIIFLDRQQQTVFIFDRQGKAKNKIKRQGQSGEEYAMINNLCYDKDNKELYVNDMMKKKIFIYDLEGHYKRSFQHLQNTQYSHIYNFSYQYLMCYNEKDGGPKGFEKEKRPFKIISKQTGELVKELDIPFSKRISKDIHNGSIYIAVSPEPALAVKMGDEWLLNEVSSDTIYQLSKDLSLTPVMAKTPSVQTMESNLKFLGLVVNSYNYRFMFILKMEFDLKSHTGFPLTNIMYNKKEDKIFEQNFYDANRPAAVFAFNSTFTIMGENNQYCEPLNPLRLKQFLKNGELTGKLKEVAQRINEDDNLALMIVTFKK